MSFASVSIPQGIGNLLSLVKCLTEDKKKIGEGVGIDNLQELTQGHILSLK